MAIKYINTGSSPNKGDGDTLRTAFNKINDTFAYLNIATGIQGSADLTGALFENNTGTYGITSIYNSTASTVSLRLNAATTTRIGGVKVGSGLSVSPDGTLQTVTAAYELPPATESTLGGIIVGDNLTVDEFGRVSGVNSYVLPAATTADLGGVIIGSGLTVDGDGIVSADVQNNQQLNTNSSVRFQDVTLAGTGGDPYWNDVTVLLHGNNFTDYSPNPQTVSQTGVTIDNSVYKFGSSSYAFDNTDRLSEPNIVANFARSNFTVEGQFYFRQNNVGYQPLMANAGSAGFQGWLLFIDTDNTLKLLVSQNSGSWNYQFTTSYTPPTNQWIHIAIDRTVDLVMGDTLTLYVNGTSVGGGSVANWHSPTNAFYLGYYPFFVGGPRSFLGNIDEVRITIGTARYQGSTFSVPTEPYPNFPYSADLGQLVFGDGTIQTTAWTDQTIPTDISQLTDTQNLLLQAGSVWELSSGTRHVSLSNTGGLILADPFPVSFTALLLPVYGGGTNGPYGGDAWSFNVTFNNNSGVVTTTVDNIFPILNNPGYKNGDSWNFTEADHGIPGYTFTLTLSNVVHPGGAGWTANVSVSPPPNVNQVPVLGFPDGTIQTTAWTGVGGGNGSVVQQDTAPDASTSTIWYDTVSGRTYVYFDNNWIDASPAPATVDLSTVTQSIIPSEDSVYDLGSPDKQWKSLYVSTNTIYVGNVPLTVDTATNTLLVNGSQVTGGGGSATTSTLVNNGYTLSVDDTGVVTFPAFIGSPSLVTIQSTSTGVDLNVTGRHWNFGANGSLTFPNGAGFGYGDSGQLKVNDGVTLSLDIRDNYGRGFYTNGDGFSLRGNGSNTWKFGTTGILTFPNNSTFDGQNLVDHATGVNYTLKIANGGVAGSKFGIGTGDATFGIANDALNHAEDGYVPYTVTAAQVNFTIPGAGTLSLDSDGNLTIPGDIKSAAGVGPVVIQSNDGTLRTWTFGGDGNITFPDTTVQTTAWNDAAFMASMLSYDGAIVTNTATIGTGGLIVNGPVQFNGTFSFAGTATVINSNSGTFYGNVNGVGALYAGVAGSTPLPATVIQSAANVNDYIQNNFQNLNHGTQASTEWVATNDTGNDSNNYIDMGIAGHGWDGTQANSVGTAAGPSDSWVYTQGTTSTIEGGNLILGTIKDGKAVKILAGSTGSNSVVAQFSSSGLRLNKGSLTFADSTVQTTAWTGTVAYSNVTGTPNLSGYATQSAVSTLQITVNNLTNTVSTLTTTATVQALIANSLTNYTTTSSVNALIANSLTNYATTSYVTTRGYLTTVTSVAYATTSSSAQVVTSPAQPTITSVGTLTSLSVAGNVTASKYYGDGSSLTNITVTQQANIVGVQTNVTLVAGSYTYLFDNTGTFTMPANGDIVMTGTNATVQVGGAITAGVSTNTAFIAGNGAVNNIALGYQPTSGPANMAIRDLSTVTTIMYFDAGSNTTSTNSQFLFRSSSAYTTWGKIDQYGLNIPTRPAFRIYGAGTTGPLSTTQNTNGVLNGNNFAVDYQQGTALSTSTGVFTAPVAGLYQVNLVVRTNSNTGVSSQVIVQKSSSGTTSNQIMIEWAANTTMNHTGGSTIVKMAVGDTLYLKVTLGVISFDANDSWSVAYIG